MTGFSCTTCGSAGTFGVNYPTTSCTSWRKSTQPCPPCLKLKIIDDHIAETRAFLDHLEAHRDALKADINASHDPFTNVFPTEIAHRIFSLCRREGPEIFSRYSQYGLGHLNRAPLSLAAVCKRWQAVARSTPSLWTHVYLYLGCIRGATLSEDVVRGWLRRSGCQLLSIYLHIDDYDSSNREWDQLCRSVIGIISDNSRRWQSLSLTIPLRFLSLFRCLPHDVDERPHLRKLFICPAFSENPTHVASVFDIGTSFRPSPDTVYLSDCLFQDIHIDWMNVTQVTIEGFCLSDCFELLKSAPLLFTCTFERVAEYGDDLPSSGGPIVHHRLKTLVIEIMTHSNPSFFDNLTLPSLERLTYFCHISEEPLDDVTSLLDRSECPINFLSISESTYPHDTVGLFDLLWSVPTIEGLELYNIALNDEFFELLALDVPTSDGGEYGEFLPRLQTLVLSISDGPHTFSWPALYQSLWKRVSHKRTEDGMPMLKRVQIDISTSDDDEGYYIDELGVAAFQTMIDEGVEFRIHNSYRRQADDVLAYSRAYHQVGNHEPVSDA
ncbi:hypothetical protein NLJ89_g4260 [Agrocybe chaxingu]|uniref:F-box domain-containing protein n=1 Tax=Agrocybe chaxingu TaxID=84603 RepID=A0A9W8K4B9_9AGAR|nr:hypothetical protein NLJ89_g4260 [Agrocybe chaxingu]